MKTLYITYLPNTYEEIADVVIDSISIPELKKRLLESSVKEKESFIARGEMGVIKIENIDSSLWEEDKIGTLAGAIANSVSSMSEHTIIIKSLENGKIQAENYRAELIRQLVVDRKISVVSKLESGLVVVYQNG